MSAGLCPLLVSGRSPVYVPFGQEDTAQLNAHQPQLLPDPGEKALSPRTVRAQTHVRKITLACILQHSEVLHPGGHWRHRSGSGGWWTAQEAIHSSELEPRLFRREIQSATSYRGTSWTIGDLCGTNRVCPPTRADRHHALGVIRDTL